MDGMGRQNVGGNAFVAIANAAAVDWL